MNHSYDINSSPGVLREQRELTFGKKKVLGKRSVMFAKWSFSMPDFPVCQQREHHSQIAAF